jgi:hypothetical protein
MFAKRIIHRWLAAHMSSEIRAQGHATLPQDGKGPGAMKLGWGSSIVDVEAKEDKEA